MNIGEILYIEALGNYTKVFTRDKTIITLEKLSSYLTILPSDNFVRVHKSYLININEVTGYRKGKGGTAVLSTGKEIMVSASQKANLLAYFK